MDDFVVGWNDDDGNAVGSLLSLGEVDEDGTALGAFEVLGPGLGTSDDAMLGALLNTVGSVLELGFAEAEGEKLGDPPKGEGWVDGL